MAAVAVARGKLAIWLVLLTSFLVAGCATQGKPFFPIQGEAGKSILYVYRENGLLGRGLELEILANGESLATLAVGTFHAMRIEPGHYDFEARATRGKAPVLSGVQPSQLEDNTLLALDIVEAHTYYVVVEEGLGYVLLEPVAADEAQAKLAKLVQAATP